MDHLNYIELGRLLNVMRGACNFVFLLIRSHSFNSPHMLNLPARKVEYQRKHSSHTIRIWSKFTSQTKLSAESLGNTVVDGGLGTDKDGGVVADAADD